ncbi:MAG TPA: MerR family DNA-binding transcriptional regulator [Streptosporangiaceae bacterium]
MPTFRIKEAAALLGVSTDTLRRWADGGRIDTTVDTHSPVPRHVVVLRDRPDVSRPVTLGL